MNGGRMRLAAGVLVALALAGGVRAAPRTTAAEGDWSDPATWTGSIVPQAGDTVVINHAVTLGVTTPDLAAFSNNATLTFNGWETWLRATEVVINATITHPAQSATSTNEFGEWVPDHRLWIVCSNLTVNSGRIIDVNAKGYAGGTSGTPPGKGPGGGSPGGSGWSAGGGYGGRGGNGAGSGAVGGSPYGTTDHPVDPGSGGAYGQANGGAGGGAVRIEASGHVQLIGTIRAEGQTVGSQSGGGAGGSVRITCRTISGSGTISVIGGYGGGWGGGGGGGRVAVEYAPEAQALLDVPALQIGAGRWDAVKTTGAESGEPGTIWLPDTLIWPRASMNGGGDVVIPGFTSWSVTNLTLAGGWFRFSSLTNLVVANDLHLQTGSERGRFTYEGRLTVGGTLTLNDRIDLNWQDVGPDPDLRRFDAGTILMSGNNARMHVHGGVTNAAVPDAGLVAVAGDFVVSTNTILFPYAHPANGGTLLFTAGSFSVLTNGLIDADGKGFQGSTNATKGLGPGGSPWNGNGWIAGAGYGGKGGDSAAAGDGGIGGPAYGVSNAPVECGSASARGQGARGFSGGGSIRITTTGDMRVDGTLSANGEAGIGQDGGGSGGGIFIQCRRFLGDASGILRARGGNAGNTSYPGGGGGGRIAVWYGGAYSLDLPLRRRVVAWSLPPDTPGYFSYTGTVQADGGTGRANGENGTVIWGWIKPPAGIQVTVR